MTDPAPLTITKKELVNRIAAETEQTKVVVKNILQLFLDQIVTELVQGNRLEFREFGVFEVRIRASRQAQNPRTLEKVDVPAKRVVKFKAGRTLRDRVCGKSRGPLRATRLTLNSKGSLPDSTPPSTPPTPPASNSPF